MREVELWEGSVLQIPLHRITVRPSLGHLPHGHAELRSSTSPRASCPGCSTAADCRGQIALSFPQSLPEISGKTQ